MKKALLFLTSAMLIAGCTANGSVSKSEAPTNKRAQVELSLANYQQYVATITDVEVCIDSGSYNNTMYYIYYYNFSGSNLCKFIDCKIEYVFTSDDGNTTDKYVSKLNLSGDGQTKETKAIVERGEYYYGEYKLKVVGASGTVEILY